MNDITVVIRSVSERTEKLCIKLLRDQGVGDKNLHVVRKVPFSATMKRSFEIGLEEDKDWTLCVDADILSRPGSVREMTKYAESQARNVCEIQGYILDKFFGGIRVGGFHLYRTSLLPKVIESIPPEGEDIRPESRTLKRMTERGYPRAIVPYIVGTHDDEQYNFDIYRKAFVHAVKHLNRADLLIPHWKKNADQDFDFKVALTAFSDSIRNTHATYININQDLYKKNFEKTGFTEKYELDSEAFSLADIEKRINNWQTDDRYYDHFPDSQGFDRKDEVVFRKIKKSIKHRGARTTILLSLSQTFTKLGEKLGSRIPE